MEQLKAERQEFSSELTRLSTELEQERTKTRELAKELRKYQVPLLSLKDVYAKTNSVSLVSDLLGMLKNLPETIKSHN